MACQTKSPSADGTDANTNPKGMGNFQWNLKIICFILVLL